MYSRYVMSSGEPQTCVHGISQYFGPLKQKFFVLLVLPAGEQVCVRKVQGMILQVTRTSHGNVFSKTQRELEGLEEEKKTFQNVLETLRISITSIITNYYKISKALPVI